MLQSIDIAIAYSAAHRLHQAGTWSPVDTRRDLDVPWSSLNLSLKRLSAANILCNGRVRRQALASFLPALQYLVPMSLNTTVLVSGMPTGASAPRFVDRIVGVPVVWPGVGDTVGMGIKPLYKTIPQAAARDREIYDLFAALDAARSGRARELALAREALADLVGLPAPMAA